MAKGKRKGKAPTRPRSAPKARKPKKAVRATKAGKVKTQTPSLAATMFTVTNDQLGHLAAGPAIELLRDILRAEARRIGLPPTSINISSWVDVPDGGIDATVTAPAGLPPGAVIT